MFIDVDVEGEIIMLNNTEFMDLQIKFRNDMMYIFFVVYLVLSFTRITLGFKSSRSTLQFSRK